MYEIMSILGAGGGQKKASDSLELELNSGPPQEQQVFFNC